MIDPIKKKENQRRWYLRHREEERERNTRYQAEHREQIRKRRIAHYKENRNRLLEYAKHHRQSDREGFRERDRKRWHELKDAAFEHYGGYHCSCPGGCGVTEPMFLSIDHINGHGLEHRKSIGMGNLYFWLKKNNYPPGFRVLCMNCNHAMGRRGGDGKCPHET